MKNVKTNEKDNILEHRENIQEGLFTRRIIDSNGDDRIIQLKPDQASIVIEEKKKK